MDECDNQCNTNLTCWNGCIARRGNKNASDYFKCIIDNKCLNATQKIQETRIVLASLNTPEECVMAHCKDQLVACFNDARCPAALQDC